MAESDESVFDKAEGFARRMLERLGAKVDDKLSTQDQQSLGSREISEIASRIERLIESGLKEDSSGARRIAPNRFRVLFTYEEASRLSPNYLQALSEELKATVYEYINNRRYEIIGPIEVETERNVFAKTTIVKADFEENIKQTGKAETSPQNEPSSRQSSRILSFQTARGQSYRVELKADGAPVYIGRAAGTALRIDDSSISRLHCSLALRGNGDIVVSDLGSANGTYVNEQILGSNEARPVKVGDVVGVGDIKLTVSEIT